MKIVVDQNIPWGLEAFSDAGEVVLLPGRAIRREDLLECRALIVRSITRVDRTLLEGTPVEFVGTCTIGTDHLDISWLESGGIGWASAPGCNARSVAEWVGAVVASAHLSRRVDLSSRPLAGVVGVGRVGSQVAQVLEGLGLEVLRNDPPRAEAEGPEGFSGLEELVENCRILACHLPLTTGGPHPTRGLLDGQLLSKLPRGALFLNAGRGPTASSPDLAGLAAIRPDLALALDVFDPEPAIPVALARAAGWITPHVAGYSQEGKVEGTRLVRAALGERLSLPDWTPPPQEVSPVDLDGIRLPGGGAISPSGDPMDALCALLAAAWDPARDDERLRATLDLPDPQRGEAFDRLRKEYPVRLEWRHRPVLHPGRLPAQAWKTATALGFVAA